MPCRTNSVLATGCAMRRSVTAETFARLTAPVRGELLVDRADQLVGLKRWSCDGEQLCRSGGRKKQLRRGCKHRSRGAERWSIGGSTVAHIYLLKYLSIYLSVYLSIYIKYLSSLHIRGTCILFECFNLMQLYSSTPPHLRGKHFTFYSTTFVWQL